MHSCPDDLASFHIVLMRRPSTYAFVATGCVLAGFIAWIVLVSGPPVRVSPRNSGALWIDLRFVSEYCVGVSSVTVIGEGAPTPLWQIRARLAGERADLCGFELRAGENPAPPDHGDIVAAIPSAARTFGLAKGALYRGVVCGYNGFAHERCSVRRLQF
jgi:hypothetical protein